MKIKDIYKNINDRTILSDYAINNKMVAIKDNILSRQLYYEQLFLIQNDKLVDSKKSNKPMYNICFEDTKQFLFYPSYELRENNYYLCFSKICLANLNEELICEIKMKTNLISKGFIYTNCTVKAIDQRYFICLYKDDDTYLISSDFVLIDSYEKRYYNINPKISSKDTFYRHDLSGVKIVNHDGKRYLLFKTGSIMIYEKEDEYRRNKKNICNEQFAIYEIETLINSAKNSEPLTGQIFERQNDEGSFDYIGSYKNRIFYVLVSFKENTTSIISYDILNNTKKIIRKDNFIHKFQAYIMNKDNIYGFFNEPNKVQLENLISGNIFTYTFDQYCPHIVYYDENIAVLQFHYPLQSEWNVVIYDVKKNMIQNEYKNRKAKYYSEDNILVLH